LYRRSAGITCGVSAPGNDNPETSRQAEDDLLQQQEESPVEAREAEPGAGLTDEDEQ